MRSALNVHLSDIRKRSIFLSAVSIFSPATSVTQVVALVSILTTADNAFGFMVALKDLTAVNVRRLVALATTGYVPIISSSDAHAQHRTCTTGLHVSRLESWPCNRSLLYSSALPWALVWQPSLAGACGLWP